MIVRLWQHGVSLALLIAVWQLAASFADLRELPPPLSVARAMVDGLAAGEMLHHVAVTLARVAASFALAMVVGTAVGLALGRSALLDRLFGGWLLFFLNLPALVVIILCYVWFGLGETAALTAVAASKIPNVAVVMREGARTLDEDLRDMARVFRFGPWRLFRHVVMPQLAPFLLAAARSGLSLIWKIVLVVELLGRSNGVGFQLHVYFQLFDVTAILAYAMAFILVVQAIEWGILQPAERRLARWRR
ncbi:ABC transporter permease [Azospirillum halopraeferens]|uniref:ABC transporter permease n=1 Tax=Azospirillum halopraeferens TaxID=34010 RepID=UPI000427CE83|nr:ABC transporter permease [Azospirillum halopraeferens]